MPPSTGSTFCGRPSQPASNLIPPFPGLCPSLVSCLWLLGLQFWDLYPCRCFIPASGKPGAHCTT